MTSGLLHRHVAFLEALRGAGLAVSLAEDLDAVAALSALPWDRRSTVRDAYAATLVKKRSQRPTFDTLFDVYFPRLVGEGVGARPDEDGDAQVGGVRDNAQALADFRAALLTALAEGDPETLSRLAVEMVARFGAMPGRGPGLSSWSAYTALQRVAPAELTAKLVQALLGQGHPEEAAVRLAGRRVGELTRRVEDDARRRIAEEKGPEHVADVAVRPSIDRLDFTAARKSDLEEMRREIYPLARRLATRSEERRVGKECRSRWSPYH